MDNKKRVLMVGLTLLMMLVLGVVTAGCGGSGSNGGSGDEVTLAYTYTAGDSWAQEMTMTTSGTMEGLEEETEAGAAATTTEEITKMRVTTKVDKVNDDGGANLTVTYETLESTVNGEAKDLTGQEPKVVTITVDKTGKVISTESTDAGSNFLESGQMFGSSDFGGEFSNMIYPADGTAKVGEEWTSTSTMPLPGMDQELNVTTVGRLTGISTENGREVATIEYSTTIPMDLKLDLGEMLRAMMEGFGTESTEGEDMAFKMTMKGDIVFTGVAKVETATGQAVSSDGDGTIDFEMQITEAPEEIVPSNQRGPFTSNMTMTVTMVEVQ
jgi:hypothetical protein